MKSIIVIIPLLCVAIVLGSAQWQRTNLPVDVRVNTLAIRDSFLFAGTDGEGILVSTDNGEHWGSMNEGLQSKVIHTIFINGTTLFAGTESGASRSTNNGLTWDTINSGLSDKGVWSFAVSNFKPGDTITSSNFTPGDTTIFAGTWSGVYTSTDNGTTWDTTKLSVTTMPVHTIVVCDSIIYAATVAGGVFNSLNNGFTWNDISLEIIYNEYDKDIIPVYSLAIIDTIAVASAGNGNYNFTRYDDPDFIKPSGATQRISNFPFFCFAVREPRLFAGNSNGDIFISTFDGPNWNSEFSSLGIHAIYSLALNSSYIFAGTEIGIWRLWYPDIIPHEDDGGAGWTKQKKVTTKSLYGVSFTEANTGTIVGDGGLILHTANRGASWTSQISGTTSPLWGVSFTDANTGTVVGGDGTILRTINGGVSWTSQISGTTIWLFGVSFTDANTGTAVGGDGTILRTTNGGATWTSQTSGTMSILSAVSFSDADTGTAVGSDGTILRTTNEGVSWTSQISGTTSWLQGVFFSDANTGTAVGLGGTILRTTNGGASWTSQISGTTSWLKDVFFTDANTGTAVGNNGIILRTKDGGATWTVQKSGTTKSLYGVSFTDPYIGTAVGEDGTILNRPSIEVTGVESKPISMNQIPNQCALEQNYPNPFNPSTTISVSIPVAGFVTLKVYNSLGQEVAVLLDGFTEPNSYRITFNATGLPSGVYFYRLKVNEHEAVKKMVLLK